MLVGVWILLIGSPGWQLELLFILFTRNACVLHEISTGYQFHCASFFFSLVALQDHLLFNLRVGFKKMTMKTNHFSRDFLANHLGQLSFKRPFLTLVLSNFGYFRLTLRSKIYIIRKYFYCKPKGTYLVICYVMK